MFSLTYVENTGGAYGIGQNNIITFIIINIIVIGIIAKLIIKNINSIDNFILIDLGLILSGGIGNLLDRIFRGYVIDYIDINQFLKFPVFNFADICIVMGGILIAVFLVVDTLKNKQEK